MSRFTELKVTGIDHSRFSNSPIAKDQGACVRRRTAAKLPVGVRWSSLFS